MKGVSVHLIVIAAVLGLASMNAPAQYNTADPSSPVKLIFIHHSTGEAWLADGYGNLGITLKDHKYFVSDTNYGWGPNGIGNNTDFGHWWDWFRGSSSSTYLTALFAESGQHCSYDRLATDPGGANRIVMFKSCFPNSSLQGSLSDPIPPIASNPLKSQAYYSSDHTVSNAKGIYLDLMNTFAQHPETLFIVVAEPPLQDGTYAANARAFTNWLSKDWMACYPYHNAFVFDYFTVLTTNGGDSNTNDLGWASGNHHRYRDSAIELITNQGGNTLAYPTGDDHPSAAGDQKATGEFQPLLNIAYHCWQGDGGCQRVTGSAPVRIPSSLVPTKITTANHGLDATLTWDSQHCPSTNYHVIYGYGSGLPAWTLQTSPAPPCGIGTTGTVTWSSVPDPPSGERFLWFLVVGDDGGTVEGSWGLTSAGAERGGTLPSGVCGKSTKSTALVCLAQ